MIIWRKDRILLDKILRWPMLLFFIRCVPLWNLLIHRIKKSISMFHDGTSIYKKWAKFDKIYHSLIYQRFTYMAGQQAHIFK